jgi:hypothetical protein
MIGFESGTVVRRFGDVTVPPVALAATGLHDSGQPVTTGGSSE